MKFSMCILIFFTSNGFAIDMENSEKSALCNAIENIVQLEILTPPLNIQLMDKSFANCIDPSRSTILINFCSNTTRLKSRSSIVITKSEGDVLSMNPICMNEKELHMIVISKSPPSNLNELVDYFWRKLFINVSFLVISSSKVLIQTFIPYNDKKCNDTELKTINQFDVTTRTWNTDQFFPKKLKDFHQCSVKVATYQNIVPYIVREETVNGKRILKGRVIEMIHALAKVLNFTTELHYEPSIAGWENCFQKVANNEVDLFIGNTALDLLRVEYLDFTIPVFFEFLKFVVPPGRSFTQMENFSRVFDMLTWILILCVLVSTGIAILALSLRSKRVKIYAFGVGYQNAFMDFLAAVFGLSGASMPDLTIPRMIIIKFLLFCFIIRTIYQASLFNFLQSHGNVKEVQSIDEMINRGFTFFMLKQYDVNLDLSKYEHVSKNFVNISEFDELLEKISDSNFKGTLMHTSSVIVYKNQLKDKKYQNLFCKEYLMTISMVGYLRKNFYLTEVVNEQIGFFHNAGLIIAWDKLSKNVADTDISVEDTRRPISLQDFKGIFMLYLIGCTGSILSFTIEITFTSLGKRLSGKI